MPDIEFSDGWGAELYPDADRHALPAEAVAASLGCGNPLVVADLHEGETVLDLGSGGGIDVLLSARRVGPTGKAYGVDMTDEMLALARANADKAGASNVEFVKGTIEAVPLPDASVDVIISNCVINLSTDKPAVLAEAHRLLRPGGRFGVSDVVADDHLDPPRGPSAAATSAASPGRSASASTATAWPPPGSPTSPLPPTRSRTDALGDHPSEQADNEPAAACTAAALPPNRPSTRPHRRRGEGRQRLRMRLLTFGGHDNRVGRPPMGGSPPPSPRSTSMTVSAPPRRHMPRPGPTASTLSSSPQHCLRPPRLQPCPGISAGQPARPAGQAQLRVRRDRAVDGERAGRR